MNQFGFKGISLELRRFNLTTFKGIINGAMKYKVLNLHISRIYFCISLCKSVFYD